jgi:hypothetical protein
VGFDEKSMGVCSMQWLVVEVGTSVGGLMGRGGRNHDHDRKYNKEETFVADWKHGKAT